MNTFNAERLKSARIRAGLSMRQLEEKLHHIVSYNSINKYEKGQMQPEPGTIIKLAEVLKVTPAYFFETSTIELGEVDFRRRTSLTQTEIGQIKVKTRDKVQRYLEAESLLGLSRTFTNPISRKQVKEIQRAEEMADLVRTEWELGLNPIPNVIEMLEEHEVKVLEVDASEKFDGLSTYVNNEIPVAVINENFPVERKRFTALHELGHLLMNLKMESEKEREAACHRFAGALLFPESEVRKTLGNKRSNIAMGELVAIKEEYGISAQAAMRRAYDLDIISQSQYKTFCIKMAGNRKEEGWGNFKGEEKSYRLMQMAFRLASEKITSMENAAAIAGLPVTTFKSLWNNVPQEEEEMNFYLSPLSSFAQAWNEDEPEYTMDNIKSVNPDYEPG